MNELLKEIDRLNKLLADILEALVDGDDELAHMIAYNEARRREAEDPAYDNSTFANHDGTFAEND
jgi:hypothetical protein